MKKASTSKLSTWLILSPLKFAFISFATMCILILTYGYIANNLLHISQQTQTISILAISFLTIIICGFIMASRLPRDKMSRHAFVSINTMTLFTLSLLFLILIYTILANPAIVLTMLLLPTVQSMIIFGMMTLILLYLVGLFISNIYAKICRIRTMNIPTWKTILSIPFGFSALWIPGFFLDIPLAKTSDTLIKSKWYKKLIDLICSHQLYLSLTFTLLTIMSILFYGATQPLLTIVLALIYGIWQIQIGRQKFTTSIPKKYATTAVIINLVICMIILCSQILAPKITNDIQLNISELEMASEPTQ